MERRGAPWLVVLLAAFAVAQGPRLLVESPDAPAEQESEKAPAGTKPETKPAAGGSAVPAPPPAPGEPLGLLRDFFGLPRAASPGSAADLDEVLAEADRAHYRLESLIALVPDPVDSNLAAHFDQAVEAIQSACGDARFVLDRFWLPWTAERAAMRAYRTLPGMLRMARPTGPGGRPRLLAVLLVGETLKQGVHKPALHGALGLAARCAAPASRCAFSVPRSPAPPPRSTSP
jgi:hypothetical protein